MSKFYAVRNISLCSKDCLCLYVCPTGATDTENSIIDKSKCIGCGACAKSCPSGAISMVPTTLPPQQKHSDATINAMTTLLHSKSNCEKAASSLSGRLAKAIARSSRIMAEDISRESGYMLPQSKIANTLLTNILNNATNDSQKQDTQALIDLLTTNE